MARLADAAYEAALGKDSESHKASAMPRPVLRRFATFAIVTTGTYRADKEVERADAASATAEMNFATASPDLSAFKLVDTVSNTRVQRDLKYAADGEHMFSATDCLRTLHLRGSTRLDPTVRRNARCRTKQTWRRTLQLISSRHWSERRCAKSSRRRTRRPNVTRRGRAGDQARVASFRAHTTAEHVAEARGVGRDRGSARTRSLCREECIRGRCRQDRVA